MTAGNSSQTFTELDARANRIAHAIRNLGVGANDRVALALGRSPDLVAGLMGVLKAGAAYVPLDLSHPPERLAFVVADANVRAVLGVESASGIVVPPKGVPVLNLDSSTASLNRLPSTPPDVSCGPDHLAYVLHTSGSTGRPKGVMVHHRGLVNYLTWAARAYNADEGTGSLVHSPLSFDLTVTSLLVPLIVGKPVHLLPDDAGVDALLDALTRHRDLTLLKLTPAHLSILSRTLDPRQAAGLARVLVVGGEALPAAAAAWWRRHAPQTRVVNEYGPTETVVGCCVHDYGSNDPETGDVPIGKPIANTRLYVLNDAMQLVPPGEVGELYIGGDGVTLGYLDRPELTEERFVPDPFVSHVARMYKTGDLTRWRADGVLEYLGRRDDQVKIRGFRIELGEVESALASHPAIAAAAVKVWGQPPQLAAYVVLRAGEQQNPETLRQHLRKHLPAYMTPASITFLDALPLTSNGKVDRRNLPEPALFTSDQESVQPRTDAEKDVLSIWTEVLGRLGFGVTDNFFELGGSSLQAAEIVSRIRQQLGFTIPLGAMSEANTVEKLATLIQHGLEAGSEHSLVPLHTEGTQPPLFMIAGVGGHVFTFQKFAKLLGADYPVYGLKAIGVDGNRPPLESFEEIAAEYVREITAARPQGPYVVSGYSVGAHVALEVAFQLEALGHTVPLVIVFDMPAPGYQTRLSTLRRLRLHLRNLFGRQGGFRYAAQRFRNIGNRVLRLLGLERVLFPYHPGLDSLPQESIRAVWLAMQRATRRYHPQGRLNGSVTLFRSELPIDVWESVVHVDADLGWEQYTNRLVEVHTVPLGHLEIFHESNIESLARQVVASIERADKSQKWDRV
ncbi:MAG: amino acid adenylation domain-containing protein [Planctomycetes bacterium]|nr:amino acid adenylation domain-containing protein [Planctomycetota bacterium]